MATYWKTKYAINLSKECYLSIICYVFVCLLKFLLMPIYSVSWYIRFVKEYSTYNLS